MHPGPSLVLAFPLGWEMLWHVPHRTRHTPWVSQGGLLAGGGGGWRWRAQCQGPCGAQASGGAGSWHEQHCKEWLLSMLHVKWLHCRLVWSHSIFMSAVPAAGRSLADFVAVWV